MVYNTIGASCWIREWADAQTQLRIINGVWKRDLSGLQVATNGDYDYGGSDGDAVQLINTKK
jgi:hypothetical protein